MTVQLQIPPNQLPDLECIRDLGVNVLERVERGLSELPTPLMTVAELSDAVGQVIGDGERFKVDALVGQMLAWSQVARNRAKPIDQVLDGIQSRISNLTSWNESEKRKWQEIQAILQRLCQSKAFRVVSKTVDLSYDYANLFEGARIVTDIRPVFNDKDEEEDMDVDGAVVSYTLRLHYDNRSGRQSLSITLDEIDIESLAYQCDRALRKGRLAQNKFSSVPIVRAGKATDE